MFDFSTITEVQLASGNHSSPAEGMCLMELVSWFAGENHSDKPQCACPVLGVYGIRLNDSMPDDLRDALLKPLVPMIAGTRDEASENKRAEFLALWATNKIAPLALRAAGFESHAVACEKARTIGEARTAANTASTYAAYYANAANAANAPANAAYYTAYAAYYANAAYAAVAPANAAYYAANAANAAYANDVWPVAVEGLRQAILIGRHDGFADAEPVIEARRVKLIELAA